MQESHIEKCYRVPEIAKAWQLSEDTVRKVFRDEPGVILIGHGELLHKRPRFTLCVPESVFERVKRKLSVQ